jgi:hypothetical protein
LEPILINNSEQTVRIELEYIIKRELNGKFRNLTKWYVGLAAASLIFWIVAENMATDRFATIFAILIYFLAIIWLVAIGVLIYFLYIRYTRNRWKSSVVKSVSNYYKSYYLSFDDEKIYFTSDNHSGNLTWKYFKYYHIKDDILFLISENNIYDHMAFSEEEIGRENLSKMLLIAEKKLSPLSEL